MPDPPSPDDRVPRHGDSARAFLEPERHPVEVSIEMLDDLLARAEKLIADNGWERAEGLRIVFSGGVAALERDAAGGLEIAGKRLIDVNDPQEREQLLLARLSDLESRYAVMKFTSFNALRDNQSLKMNVTGLTTEYQALVKQNKYLRGREDELRERIAGLERDAAALTARLERHATPPRTRWERIRELVRAIVR